MIRRPISDYLGASNNRCLATLLYTLQTSRLPWEDAEQNSIFFQFSGYNEPWPDYESALESRQYVVKFDVKNDVKSAPLAPLQLWKLQLSITYQ